MTTQLTCKSTQACFRGSVGFYSHDSSSCHSEMRFAVYQPPQAQTQPVPVLYFLSGLTCNEENFITKAGAMQYASQYGLMLVAPDTSPRSLGIPGEDDSWDFGTGAGFYVDAIEQPWADNYRMYSYVVEELPNLIEQHFPATDQRGIFGHSMGGHGALVCGLRNPDRYQSISAFAPIAAPTQCPWGEKAFTNYLGLNKTTWAAYDASILVLQHQFPQPILIDQGTKDTFLATQLMPEIFAQACEMANQPLILRMQEGYDHSYYFIATFIGDHIRHHALILNP